MKKEFSILWTKEAQNTYLNKLDFIFEKWTITEVENFEILVVNPLLNLEFNDEICPEIKIFGLRKCLISSQTSLLYRIVTNKIELISFIDNRSEHKFIL